MGLVLIGMTMAFALPVSAADVKFSGSYVAQGYYDNNRALLKDGGADGLRCSGRPDADDQV